MGQLLLRGMLVGILAGLLAFGFARVFGEPQVARAVALEGEGGHHHGEAEAGEHDHDAAHDPGAGISRGTQAGIGLLTGTTVYGVALGGVLALVFAGVQGRLSALRPRATVALLALGGFVALVLVPGLKYPANPPAVGSPETIGIRTATFFMMLLFSVGAMILGVMIARHLTAAHGAWTAWLVGIGAYVVLVALVMLMMPTLDEVSGSGFPAGTLWEFRLASLAIRAVVWAVLGIGFGIAAERVLARGNHQARA
ncbi:CbtA family protein [Amaricoccus solimangrovi]|nr:CbtA family protein [Amaricoccus solimangrovi]